MIIEINLTSLFKIDLGIEVMFGGRSGTVAQFSQGEADHESLINKLEH
jgi:hypothetical protein